MISENVSSNVQALMWSWLEWKLFLERSVAFSQDAVHVIVGVLLMIAAALLLRKPISSWWPWVVVLAATLINEFVDLWVEQWPEAAMQYGEGAKDVLVTMFVPTVLLVSARLLPGLYEPVRHAAKGKHPGRRRTRVNPSS